MSVILEKFLGQSTPALLLEGAAVVLLFGKLQEASATPDPTPDPGTPTQTGLYGPLYDVAMRNAMVPVNDGMDGIPNLFTINTQVSGPVPLGNRPDLENDCRVLKTGNPQCKRLGYIATDYGNKNLATAKAEVDLWATWAAAGLIDGIMEDEQANTLDKLQWYTDLAAHIRSKPGLTTIRGNPGAGTPRQYIQLNDITSVHEGTSQPTEAAIKSLTFYPEFPKTKFNYLQDGKATLDVAYVKMLTKYFGSLFITNYAGDPIRYFNPPTYLSQLAQTLKETPAS